MNIKNILIFVGGFTIGGAAGILGSKRFFQDKYQKQYEEDHIALEEYYHRTDEYTRRERLEEEFEDNEVNPIEGESKPGGRMSAEEREEIKKKLNRNWEGTTNYAKMYRKKNENKEDEIHMTGMTLNFEDKPEEKEYLADEVKEGWEHPICENCTHYDGEYCDLVEEAVNTDDSCSDFTPVLSKDTEPNLDEEAFDEHQKNKHKPPKIISADAYSNLPASIDQAVLYFYTYDEVLCEDNEEPVEEPERLVGDALIKYGFIDSDERIIFVMNYALDTCYEIQKVDASWSDTH